VSEQLKGSCGGDQPTRRTGSIVFKIEPVDGPVTVKDYVDVLAVWLPEPLSLKDLRHLNSHSAKMTVSRYPLAWAPRWQGIRLYQPQRQAIEFLAEHPEVLVTYAEIARDVIRDDEAQVQAWLDHTYGHLIQRWHGQRRQRRWQNGNWRSADLAKDGRRIVGTVFQAYGDRHSKVTGEFNCCHLEAKVFGSVALRRIGISHPEDLLDFDYQAFWDRYFLILDVDRERLGRWWDNRRTNSRRRTPIISRHGYNVDRSTGNILVRIYGQDSYGNNSTQLLIDNLGRGPWIVDKSERSQGLAVGTSFLSHNISRP
jgi:hypothetical protein